MIERSIENNIKSFWDYSKSKSNNLNGLPKTVHYKDAKGENLEEISDLFADYFQSVYEPASDQDLNEPEDLLNTNLHDLSFSPVQVFEYLDKLDPKKASGPDLIPSIFLKKCSSSLAYPLSMIYNMSLASGKFPDIWKKAFITPIHKNGSKNDVENYRPICKLSGAAKVFESLVTDALFREFKPHIISEQHGFFKGRSTCTNLTSFSEYVHRSLDDRSQVDVIYTDFSKAFDKVNHNRLMSKLRSSGIHGNLLRWLTSYINNRTQIVKLGSSLSKDIFATSGVPQGSHIGPLLFLLFINDISSIFKSSRILLFADDLKIYSEVKSIEDCLEIQSELDNFITFCDKNYLALNVKKCHVLSFTRKTSRSLIFNYKLNNSVIDRVTEICDLGVTFDSKLLFNKHIHIIVNKALRMMGFMMRVCSKFSSSAPYLYMFRSLVRCHLEYCSPIWSPFYNINKTRIESVQRRFCRILNFRKFVNLSEDYNYFKYLKVLKIDSLDVRRKKADLIFFYKCLNNLIDCEGFISYFNFSCPSVCTRNYKLFYLNSVNSNIGFSSTVYRLMDSYNNCGANIDIFQISLPRFKRRLSEILIC